MKTFTPSPAVRAVLAAIPGILAVPIPTAAAVDSSGNGNIAITAMPPNLPPIPPRPTDPEGAALHDHVVVPLYNIAVQFQRNDTTAVNAAQARHPVPAGPGGELTPDQQAVVQRGNLQPYDPLAVAYDYWLTQGYTPAQAWASAVATQPQQQASP